MTSRQRSPRGLDGRAARRARCGGPRRAVDSLRSGRGRGGSGPDGLERCLEERLVDLPVVDRDAFLDADADDLVAVHPRLLGELFGRQVVGHAASFWQRKSPPAQSARVGLRFIRCRGGSSGPPLENVLHALSILRLAPAVQTLRGPLGSASGEWVLFARSGCGAAW